LETKKSGGQSNLAEKWKVMPESYYYKSELDNRRMSFLSKRMLDRIDYTQVVEKRRKNYLRLLTMFSDNSNVMPMFRELPPGVCPLVFPVIVQNREKICIELNKQHIHAIPWWAGYHRDLSWNGFEDARFLKDHVLALPIHQDLTEDEVNFIGNRFLAAI
jgi:dTDP-4-amino-4,6-dideoxygalactose transaminase